MIAEKIRSGKRVVGTMVRMVRNPAIAQIAKAAGLDFIMLDMEHGPFSIETFSDVAKVARSIDLGIFVRVPELSRGYVSRIMDAGAQGVMVPMLSNIEQADALVSWARYTPIGDRGLSSNGELTDFAGAGPDTGTFMKNQNFGTIAIAQIETAEAITNIEDIAAKEGIDVLLIGPNDLSISMGVPGQIMGDVVQDAIGKVASAARKHGKVFAIHGSDALLDKWLPEGLQVVMSSLDIGVLSNGFKAIAQKFSV